MTRQIVVVDVETTGLHQDAAILEVAAVNVRTGEELSFVPYVDREALADAQPTALRINRYYERGVFSEMLDLHGSRVQYARLHEMLNGNTFAGSNPTFDTRLIRQAQYDKQQGVISDVQAMLFGIPVISLPFGEPWHYRLLDLSAYAAGVLGLDPAELPGQHAVCELLGVANAEEHSALGDARAAAECFRRLMDGRAK